MGEPNYSSTLTKEGDLSLPTRHGIRRSGVKLYISIPICHFLRMTRRERAYSIPDLNGDDLNLGTQIKCRKRNTQFTLKPNKQNRCNLYLRTKPFPLENFMHQLKCFTEFDYVHTVQL